MRRLSTRRIISRIQIRPLLLFQLQPSVDKKSTFSLTPPSCDLPSLFDGQICRLVWSSTCQKMRFLPKIKHVIAGLGAAGGVVAAYVTVNALESDKKSREHDFRHNPFSESPISQFEIRPNIKWDHNWDKRNPAHLQKPKSAQADVNQEIDKNEKVKATATRNLILIRHGQYNLNGPKDEDRYLTTLGIEQANLTGKRLKELGLPFTALIQSSMTRARETAKVISGHLPDLPVHTCDLLREGAPYPPEPPISRWRPEHHFYEDGARIEAAYRKYFHRAEIAQEKDSYEVVVCHANVIRYFVCRALQLPPEAWLRMSLYNGSITLVAIRPSGRVVLRTLGDAGHMPADKLTTT